MAIQFNIIEHNGGYAVEGKASGKRTHFNDFHPETGRPGDVMGLPEAESARTYLEALYAEPAES